MPTTKATSRHRSRIAILAVLLSTYLTCLNGSPPGGPVSACKVLRDIGKYSDAPLEISGVFVSLQHGYYLRSAEKCDAKIQGIRIRPTLEVAEAWHTAGGIRGTWVVAVMGGSISNSDPLRPTFKVSTIRDMKTAKAHP
jgi:hypothetical protein